MLCKSDKPSIIIIISALVKHQSLNVFFCFCSCFSSSSSSSPGFDRGTVFFPGIYSCTGIFNNYWEKREFEITGLGKKVVWVFPKRNGKLLGGWLAFPAVTVKFP